MSRPSSGGRSAEDYVTHLQAITTGFSPATSAQTVSCADLAQACAALGRDLTAPKGITFSWQTDPHPLPDRALSLDRTAFLRAAENLLSNGVRYTPAGQALDCGLRLTAQRLFSGFRTAGRLLPRGTGQGRQALLHRGAQPPPGRASGDGPLFRRPDRPGPRRADYAWKTPPAGPSHPVDFYFIIFPQFFQKPLRFWKNFRLMEWTQSNTDSNETEADYAMNWWKPALGGLLAAGSLVPILARRSPRPETGRPPCHPGAADQTPA